MADPLSISSGVVALAVFAMKSSTVLYDLINSFRSSQRTVRELREELGSLSSVLRSLQETATVTDADFSMLTFPLIGCNKACKEFEAVILKFTAQSSESRSSFKDWAKLKYLGDDIVGFKNLLAGYKSTISIALADVNIRMAAITVHVLEEYKEIIRNTTSDLEDHLQKIDNRLQNHPAQDVEISDEGATEQRRLQEERDNAQHCLDICVNVMTHIDRVQPNAFVDFSTAHHATVTTFGGLSSPLQITYNTFRVCKETLSDTAVQLERQLQGINNQLRSFPRQPLPISSEQAAERDRLQEERDFTKQNLVLCAQASLNANRERTNVYEDISMVDDGFQVLVSTVGDLISAKGVSAGSKSVQLIGQMSDDSLKELSQTISQDGSRKAMMATNTEFDSRYGTGVKLSVPGARSPRGT